MQYCLLASTLDFHGTRRLERSDRAAVHFALQSDSNAQAVCASDDPMAWEFALAAGIQTVLPAESTSIPEFETVCAGIGYMERFGEKEVARWAVAQSALLLFDVLSCDKLPGGHRSMVCDAGRGALDILEVRGPSVLVISPVVARPPYVSRHRRQVARQQPALANALSSPVATPLAWSPARPRVRSASRGTQTGEPKGADQRMDQALAMDAASTASTQHVIRADATTCAQFLVRYLAHHGFLPDPRGESSLTPIAPLAPERSETSVEHTERSEQMERSKEFAPSSRVAMPSVQRRPRWLDARGQPSRGPFWYDLPANPD